MISEQQAFEISELVGLEMCNALIERGVSTDTAKFMWDAISEQAEDLMWKHGLIDLKYEDQEYVTG